MTGTMPSFRLVERMPVIVAVADWQLSGLDAVSGKA